MATARFDKRIADIVEQKMLEFFGDPDSGLQLRTTFISTIRKRLKKKQRLFSMSEVAKRYGLR